ncbi:GAF domain-containing protein [Filimonas effusa]|uniref:PAS domain S-box protein n=1 Tax=Filimonas effusa TaxID=2508721 RepID=A0A4Q1D5E0_9BACT|nr:PAS domain S-box protein [Filimonas effusa]RXK83705.1 PAS domain S-box protein [Filimonas effusa]
MNDVHETFRLQAVQRFYELSGNISAELQQLAELAAQICNTPMALLSMIHRDKQYFLGKVGVVISETDRSISFCTHTIEQNDLLIIPDTLEDERFVHHLQVRGFPYLRFYAGATLTTEDGFNVGSICVLDKQPRTLDEKQCNALRALSAQATRLMELNITLQYTSRLLDNQESTALKLRSILDSSNVHHILLGRNYEILAYNKAAFRFIKKATGKGYIPGDNILAYSTPATEEIFKNCYQRALKGEHIHAERKVSYYDISPSWWEISYSPARDAEGNIIGVAFNASNIDDRKKVEEQITLQNTTLRNIAQLQSHQARGPLSSIIGLVQIIKEEEYKHDETLIGLLDKAVQQLDDSIREIVNKTSSL